MSKVFYYTCHMCGEMYYDSVSGEKRCRSTGKAIRLSNGRNRMEWCPLGFGNEVIMPRSSEYRKGYQAGYTARARGENMIAEAKDLNKIIHHYGAYDQVNKAVEELIELAEVLIKDVNKSEMDKDSLYEELADVLIMLEQLKIIYNIDPEEVQQEIDRKVKRTLERIEVKPDCGWK